MIVDLTQGQVAIVDDADSEILSPHTWHAVKDHHTFYARTTIAGRPVLMHRLITGVQKGVQVDHRNRNGLDNRRENLRKSTHSQNQHNRAAQRRPYPKHSAYKGLTWCASHGRWQVRIMVEGSRKLLGYFDDEIAAARAYNEAAKRFCGEFACLNDVA